MGAVAIPAMAAATVVSATGAIEQGKAESKYYKYLSSVSKENAKLSEAAGQAEIAQLGKSEFDIMGQLVTRKNETIGGQKAALSMGAGVGSKTAEQIVSDTIKKTDLDEQVLRYNTDLKMKNALIGSKAESMNYKAQAGGYDLAAKNAKSASKWKVASTILGGASSTASMGTQYKWW